MQQLLARSQLQSTMLSLRHGMPMGDLIKCITSAVPSLWQLNTLVGRVAL